MDPQERDATGRFKAKLREQDLLKVFDFETTADAPYLTVAEIQAVLKREFDIEVSTETVRNRLEAMREAGDVAKRDFGSAVAYQAEMTNPRRLCRPAKRIISGFEPRHV